VAIVHDAGMSHGIPDDHSEPSRIARQKESFGQRMVRSWWKLVLVALGIAVIAYLLTRS
jgi:hypothetical protein